jgi:hypothetical protein
MASAGFYFMHRGWQDHPVFRGEEFSRRDAFVWMVEEASYRERRIAVPKGELILSRGQFSHSLRFMAKAWKWEEPKVRRFIASLSNAKIIDASTDAGQTVITVCNYGKYQGLDDAPDAPIDAEMTQQRRGNDANKKKEIREEGNRGLSNDKPTRETRSKSPAVTQPDDVGEEVWVDFVQHRRNVKAPLTATALAGIRREASKAGWSLDDALRECCNRGWRGFKADWVQQNNGGSNGTGRKHASDHGITFDAARAFVEGR